MRSHLGAYLAVLALTIQALIPMGYMIGPRGDTGGIAITLCTSDGFVTAIMDDNGQITETKPGAHVPQPDDDHTKSICGFAAQSVASVAPTQFELAAQDLAFESPILPLFSRLTAPGRGLAAPPPPKTGPPLQA
jgi:hypothetical protein